MQRYFENQNIADDYLRFRTGYSPAVVDKAINFLAEKKTGPYDFAFDVGCGSGQLTRLLGAHFTSVTGMDISPAQIQAAKAAQNPENVTFRVGPAESLPVDDASVDLITSAMASHYYDWPVFEKEVDRALKANGCLALAYYDLIYLDHPDKETETKLNTCIDNYLNYVNDQQLRASTPDGYFVDFNRLRVSYNESTSIMSILGGGDPKTTKVTATKRVLMYIARKPADI
ncbi:putative methyltransferase DDB_G0268948 [Diadema antillarum]|uniref:putative methyltransferase DDB_G0268948 n=1 Tax=Diadema antillarum TaxID=105358 RepID=UPI003A847B17